jgi:cyclopropane fatty-acyl-phospholipid synthase-like methyltransferase
MKKLLYEIIYLFVPVDWIFGSTSKIEKIVGLAIDGRIKPGRAITLGCGVGRETIYLANMGFDVIGLDFSPTAIKKARRRAKTEGIEVPFIVDDLTNLRHVSGTFDLVTDFGALNDMNQGARDLYMENVLPLTHSDSRYLMFCFDKMLPFDEIKRRFSSHFRIEELDRTPGSGFPGSFTVYLMTRETAVNERTADMSFIG